MKLRGVSPQDETLSSHQDASPAHRQCFRHPDLPPINQEESKERHPIGTSTHHLANHFIPMAWHGLRKPL